MNFREITHSINNDLEVFESLLKELTNDTDIILAEILDYIFESRGKRVRPVLVYLTSRLFSEPTNSTHNAAVLVELMHTATLLHDDVVDKAVLRRGKTTVNGKWDDKTAVLTGDYLFAKAMKLATDNNEYKLFDIITPAIMQLSLGELQQMNKSRNFDVDEEKYYEVIRNKTASLISACCKAGAFTGGASVEQIKIVEEFGELLGIIFQIKDDLLDYTGNKKTGKEIGIDIKEGKVTLPLILAWNRMDTSSQDNLRNLWDGVSEKPEITENIIIMVSEFGGIVASNDEMIRLKQKTLLLLNLLPKTKAREALAKVIDYIISRDN
jgi:octaprenyl-diphosphate synthase